MANEEFWQYVLNDSDDLDKLIDTFEALCEGGAAFRMNDEIIDQYWICGEFYEGVMVATIDYEEGKFELYGNPNILGKFVLDLSKGLESKLKPNKRIKVNIKIGKGNRIKDQ